MSLRIESPLNIKAGSSQARGGTRLNGSFRETAVRQERQAELAVDQCVSPEDESAMLSPGHKAPALVKSCERYRVDHLWSISPDAYTQAAHPKGGLPYRGLERVKGKGG